MSDQPPDGLPRYRVLTGPDDETFCRRVSANLDLGYHLHGGPAVTYNGDRVIIAQALIWPQPLPAGERVTAQAPARPQPRPGGL